MIKRAQLHNGARPQSGNETPAIVVNIVPIILGVFILLPYIPKLMGIGVDMTPCYLGVTVIVI